jgi:hypothetical protein
MATWTPSSTATGAGTPHDGFVTHNLKEAAQMGNRIGEHWRCVEAGRNAAANQKKTVDESVKDFLKEW